MYFYMQKYFKFVVDCIYAVFPLKFLKSLHVAVLCALQKQKLGPDLGSHHYPNHFWRLISNKFIRTEPQH